MQYFYHSLALACSVILGSTPFTFAQGNSTAPGKAVTASYSVPAPNEPRWLTLKSTKPSGDATNDTIFFKWYPVQHAVAQRSPAVILLHPLGYQNQWPMHWYAEYFNKRSIACAVMVAPFHGPRLRDPNQSSMGYFVNTDIDLVVRSFEQSSADVQAVVDWMCTQRDVDTEKLGAVGISLGAILTHIIMGRDPRVKAGVAVLGGGDLRGGYAQSPVAQSKILYRLITGQSNFGPISEREIDKLYEVDPLNFAKDNLPRHVLMIEAARDMVIPPQSAQAMHDALSTDSYQPPIKWIDTNHFSPIWFSNKSIMRSSEAYLQSVWSGHPLEPDKIPDVKAPTFKAGLVMNLDPIVSPAVEWQFFKLGTRQHRSLVGLNLGTTVTGPFIGAGATVTSFLDIGAARHWRNDGIRPYASLHFVY